MFEWWDPQRLQASFCLLQRFFWIGRHLGKLGRPLGRPLQLKLPSRTHLCNKEKTIQKRNCWIFILLQKSPKNGISSFSFFLNSKKKKPFHSTLKVVGQSLCPTFALSYFPMIFSHRPHDVHDHRSLWPGVNLRFVQLEVCSWFNLVPCGPIQDRPKQTLIPKW